MKHSLALVVLAGALAGGCVLLAVSPKRHVSPKAFKFFEPGPIVKSGVNRYARSLSVSNTTPGRLLIEVMALQVNTASGWTDYPEVRLTDVGLDAGRHKIESLEMEFPEQPPPYPWRLRVRVSEQLYGYERSIRAARAFVTDRIRRLRGQQQRYPDNPFKNGYIWRGHYTEMFTESVGGTESARAEAAFHPKAAPDKALYTLRAGGPQSVVSLTNWPSSNRVDLTLAKSTESEATFRLTNHEGHAILLWNIRVQVPAQDSGTDGFGWKTIRDDYPEGDAQYSPGAVGEVRVQIPDAGQWRACALYSMDWPDSGKSYFGNYEVLSQVLTNSFPGAN